MSQTTRLISLLLLAFASRPSLSLVMPGKHRIAVVGSANQDLTSYTPVLPTLGETVMGDTFATSCGGKGANQANAAGSLNISPVSMICRLGDDVFGKALLENFRNKNVDLDEDCVLEGISSGVAAITVDTQSGDNMIIVTPGANHKLSPDNVDKALRKLKNPAVVVTQLEVLPEAALQAMKTGKELGAVTIFNPAPAPEGYSIEEFYQYVDIIIPNESELRKICGGAEEDDEKEMAKKLLNKGVHKAIVVTLGARGAMVVEKKSEGDFDITMVDAPADLPCRNDPVQDTVGAGDAFCGALSTYLSTGLSLVEAAGKACGVASMSVRRRGADYPTWEELPDSLKVTSPVTK